MTRAENPEAFLNEAYHLPDDAAKLEFYRKWAADYDRQMLELGYVSPTQVAQLLVEQLADTAADIIDIGCGTGLTCSLLAEQGYRNLYGIDYSADMLRVAGTRAIYRGLTLADLNQPLAFADHSFEAAISSGTFTHGHVGAEPMEEIFRILKPGGLLACTVHQELWQSKGFADKFDSLQQSGIASCLSLREGKFFDQGPVEGWFCLYQKN